MDSTAKHLDTTKHDDPANFISAAAKSELGEAELSNVTGGTACPSLAKHCATGSHFKEAKLTVR
jgi:type VI protein secretion system component Hcp